MDKVIFWTLLGFLAGSFPFSIVVGRIFLKTDIRLYVDGNPGGTKAWKAGGWRSLEILVPLYETLRSLPYHRS